VKSNASQSWQDIKQTLGSTKDYSFEKKDEFVAKAKTDLKALDAKIKDLSNKASNSNGESKTNTQTRLDKLREQRSALNKKLKEAKSATAENWEKAKTGFKNGYDDAKASVKDVWQWVTDKVSR
jgi:chromosome segregation ATPase